MAPLEAAEKPNRKRAAGHKGSTLGTSFALASGRRQTARCGSARRLRRDGAPYRGRGRLQRVSELVSMGDGKKFQTPARPCYSTFMRDFAGR